MGQGCDPAPRGQRAAGAPLPAQEAASATAEGETCGRSQLVFHRSPLVKEVSINKGDLGLPGNDYAHGCLLGWGHAWAQQGWAACVIRKGLTWLWTTLPPVQRPLPNSRTSPVIREYIRPRDVGERRGGTSDRKGAPSPQEGLESGKISLGPERTEQVLETPAFQDGYSGPSSDDNPKGRLASIFGSQRCLLARPDPHKVSPLPGVPGGIGHIPVH
ncbi:uncharacterized protein LOC135095004 [Scylla paramamosain]|uniref:uncharacterized protein LOC135095004 n=1 Tax=Scylla paramamosain TaxID=85552 RepID=UPI00308296A3